jgi:hypothetical protein
MLHIAYPDIKAALYAARAAEGVGSSMQQLLDDFEFLFEFAIPTVHTLNDLCDVFEQL